MKQRISNTSQSLCIYGTTYWFIIEKGVQHSYLLSPCLFNLHAEYILRKVSLDELQAGIMIGGRNNNHLRYADDTILGKKQRGTKEPLGEGEGGEWKSWLKTQHSTNEDSIQPHYIMANRKRKGKSSDRFPLLRLQNHCKW